MKNTLLKITAVLLMLILIPLANTLASGKMEVRLGEKVTLQGNDVEPGSTYKWILKIGKEIVSTQTSPIFNYIFVQQGEYDVNLTLTSSDGDVKNTSISVLAGDRYPRPIVDGEMIPVEAPLAVSYTTLPPMREDGAVHLIGDGKVLFDINVTRDDILEYRIDRNIFEDTDGNGVANDDIDNSNDDSYLLGGIWETDYKVGEATKIVAEITMVTKKGEKTKSQAEIVFDDVRREGDPVAILETSPTSNEDDQLIYLYDDPSAVAFYARRSEGKISEYRIDQNIFVDSDGDGNPSNDIDNKNDGSFTTGDVWKTEYNKTDSQIIAQLIVVGEGGKGSRVQRGIWFTDKPKPPAITDVQDTIRVTSDKSFVLKGDPINFTVEGLTQTLDNYVFRWDFDGDTETDVEIENDNISSYIYDFAGIYPLTVTIEDRSENTATFNLEVVVKDVIATTADFDFETNVNTVKFTNTSIPALKLANKTLDYTWNFGDTDQAGYEKQKSQIGVESPEYIYNKAGNYIVTLTVIDADQVIDIKTSEVFIETDFIAEEIVDEVVSDTPKIPKEGSSFIVKMLKGILYLILIVIALALLIVLGFIVFLKLQHPDLTFEELIDEFKMKLLGLLGVHDMIEEAPAEQPVDEVVEEVTTTPIATEEEAPIEGEVIEPKEETKDAPLDVQTGPVPDWMKEEDTVPAPTEEAPVEKEASMPTEETPVEEVPMTEATPTPEVAPEAEIQEGEEVDVSEKDKSDNSKPPKSGDTPSLSDQDGPVPDWLKGA